MMLSYKKFLSILKKSKIKFVNLGEENEKNNGRRS